MQHRAWLAVLAGFLIAAPTGAGAQQTYGDDWLASMEALYTLPNGDPVLLTVMWKVWSLTPVAFNQSRFYYVQVFANHEFRGLGTIEFAYAPTTGTLGWSVKVTGNNLEWHTVWMWTAWDGCSVNSVLGDLEDLSGSTTMNGQPLEPAYTLEGLHGPIAVNGLGEARKVGPGPDGVVECYPGSIAGF